ncbi:MAG: ATP-binding protein [Candidatus Eisenbacteria bacterium]|nr:ATP-binding protein [Candidatus Eisenbacteria bacterium]
MSGSLRDAITAQFLVLFMAVVGLAGLGTLVLPLPIALGLALLLGLAGTWWLADRLTRSLRELAGQVRPWAEGGVDRLPPRHGGGDEVDSITAVLENMGGSLRTRDDAREREAQKLRQILETMIEGVLVIGPDGRVSLDNATMRRLLPTIGKLTGRTAIEALRSTEFDAAVRSVLAGGPAPVLDLSVGAAGAEPDANASVGGAPAPRRTFRVSMAPLSVDEGRSVIAVFHDVSRLRELENLRRDFVANVSHELRTPLTAIKGYVETLREGDVLPADRIRFLDTVSRHTDRLSTLIEDLLELSRLESPETRLQVQPVAMETAAQRALDLLEGAADNQNVTLQNNVPNGLPLVIADAGSLEQILVNLLDNAIKYTPPGGQVTLSAVRKDGRIRVTVVDTGIGIPAGDLPRLFERFFRVDRGRSREQGGTGLGLAIVKHLVHLQGGELGVESEPGRGSTFWFTLRIAGGSDTSVASAIQLSRSVDRFATGRP